MENNKKWVAKSHVKEQVVKLHSFEDIYQELLL